MPPRRRRRSSSSEDTSTQDAIDAVANDPQALAEVEAKVADGKPKRKALAKENKKETLAADKPKRTRNETKPRKERKLTIKTYAVGLMKENIYTDQQIVDMCKANEELPNANPDTGNIKWYRWDWNKKNPEDILGQLVDDGEGNVVTKTTGKKANKAESKPTKKVEKQVTPVDPEEAAELAAEQVPTKRRRRRK